MAVTYGYASLQAAVVALAAHSEARRALGVRMVTLQRMKRLLVQAAMLHGTMDILQDSEAQSILDAIFAPDLVSCKLM